MTHDIRPKSTADVLKEIAARLYKVEQKSSSPANEEGGMGTDPVVNTITIGGIVVGSAATPPSNLAISTGTYFENVFIDVDWDAPGDGTAESYDVEYAEKVGGVYELIGNIRTSGTSARIQRLEPQTTYGIRVTAINRIGARSTSIPDSSAFADITTGIDATIPAQISSVVAVAGFKTITILWDENDEEDVANGNGLYEVTLSPASDFSSPSIIFTSGSIAVFSYLATNTQYWGRVRAIDSSGNAGPYSDTVTATTAHVDTVDLSDTAVTTSKLANLAVDNSKLAALAVDSAKLANSAVTSTKIANLAVGTAAIAALAVGSAQIANAAIIEAKIGNLAVTTAKINDLAVTTAKIANLAVDDAKIASLDAGKITAGTINADRIAANSLDVNKLTSSTLTSKTITIGAGGNLKIGDPPTTGIFINDQGIRLYSGGAVKVALDVAGTASFEGNISASTITSSTLTSATINAGTITGATIRTAATGQRLALEATSFDSLFLYTGHASESIPGRLSVGLVGPNFLVELRSPRSSLNDYSVMTLNSVAGGNGSECAWSLWSSSAFRASLELSATSNVDTPHVFATGIDELYLQFGGGTTNAEAKLRGSGNYSFLYLYGGGAIATLNCNIGLGSGFHVLDSNNSLFQPIQASAFNVSSARAVKSNIRDEGSALDRIMDMRVRRYKRDHGKTEGPVPSHIQRTIEMDEIGLMADELLTIAPEAVVTDANGTPHGINLGVLVALLVKSVQELAQRVPTGIVK